MHKFITLVIVLVAYATSAFADDPPANTNNTYNLQDICNTVQNMSYVTLCNESFTSTVQKAYPTADTVTLTFNRIEPGPGSDALCQCIKDYMREGVGTVVTANSYCTSTPNTFSITYKGAYDPANDNLGPGMALARSIRRYENPDIGGWICSQEVKISKTGFVYIELTTPVNATRVNSPTEICSDMDDYLFKGNQMDGVKRICTEEDGMVYASIYSDIGNANPVKPSS